MEVNYFKGVLETLRVDFSKGCLESIPYQFLNLRENVSVEVEV
jgi:hypothetical protein